MLCALYVSYVVLYCIVQCIQPMQHTVFCMRMCVRILCVCGRSACGLCVSPTYDTMASYGLCIISCTVWISYVPHVMFQHIVTQSWNRIWLRKIVVVDLICTECVELDRLCKCTVRVLVSRDLPIPSSVDPRILWFSSALLRTTALETTRLATHTREGPGLNL